MQYALAGNIGRTTIVVVRYTLRKMKVKIKKLSENAVMPSKAHASDAGFDLVATSRTMDSNGAVVYGTGLAFEIPEGYVGLLFPRSSNVKKDLLLSNSVGVIDSGYRGEVMLKFKPSWRACQCATEAFFLESGDVLYEVGDRIGQLIIMPIPDIEFEEADELTETDRGEGGYGSSGR